MLTKSWYLLLVLLIEGAALMAVELMGAKLVAPFYGSSLYVWTSVLAMTVVGLSIGYYWGGQLSWRLRSEKPLIVILGIAAILVSVLPYTAQMMIGLTKHLSLISGIGVTCSFLLLPPMICFGLVGPTVVRLLTDKLDNLGSIAGTTYFTSTSGGIFATFFLGYYLIPETGLKFSAMVTALSLAFLIVVYLVLVLLGKTKHSFLMQHQVQSDAAQAKPHSSQPISALVYLFAALEGATVMAVELLAARMLAPYFGSSLYVWSAVIGFTLFGLALGYFVGGRLADKYTHFNTILWVLLVASVLLMLMHFTSLELTLLFAKMDMRLAAIIVGFCLVVPPLLFLGMIPVLLIRYLTATVGNSGKITGNVFTISSASGILALLIMGFNIIPQYGLTMPSIVIGIVVGLIPFLKLISQKKYSAMLFVVFVLLSLVMKKSVSFSDDIEVQYFSEGLLGQVLVVDSYPEENSTFSSIRSLVVNRFGESSVDKKTKNPNSEYLYYVSSMASQLPENSDILILGLGGGAMANMAQSSLKLHVDAVELDERMVEVAEQYFSLNKDVNVVIDDGRHQIESTNKTYDFIFFDAFRGDIPPAHVYSLESFQKVKSLLKKNGLFIVNFFGFLEGENGKAGRSIYKTLNAAGFHTKIVVTSGKEEARNLLLVAGNEPPLFDHLRYPLMNATNHQPIAISDLFVNPEDLDLENAVILSDDKPILDRLSLEPTYVWRTGYNKIMMKLFSNGVPLFK